MAQAPARNTRPSIEELRQYFRARDIEYNEIPGQTFTHADVETLSRSSYRLRLCIPDGFPHSNPFLAVVRPADLFQQNGLTALPRNDGEFHTLGTTNDGFQIISLPRFARTTNASFFVHQILAEGRLWVTAYEEYRRTGVSVDDYIHGYRLVETESTSSTSAPFRLSQIQRVDDEREVLVDLFGAAQVKWSKKLRAFDVTTRSKRMQETYIFRVYLPSDYPNSCPVLALVYPGRLMQVNGEPVPEFSQEFHTLHRKDGHLTICHYGPNEWLNHYNVASIVNMKALPWANIYEEYMLQRDKSFKDCFSSFFQESH